MVRSRAARDICQKLAVLAQRSNWQPCRHNNNRQHTAAWTWQTCLAAVTAGQRQLHPQRRRLQTPATSLAGSTAAALQQLPLATARSPAQSWTTCLVGLRQAPLQQQRPHQRPSSRLSRHGRRTACASASSSTSQLERPPRQRSWRPTQIRATKTCRTSHCRCTLQQLANVTVHACNSRMRVCWQHTLWVAWCTAVSNRTRRGDNMLIRS